MGKRSTSRVEYGIRFYKNLKHNKQSAEVIVPLVLEILDHTIGVKELSVADFGCGTGHWLNVYKQHGIKEVFGIDRGGKGWDTLLEINADEFRRHDLNKRIRLHKKYSMVQCLETAEHIEPQNAEKVVLNLTSISDIVLFSAAIPYQRGAHHVNEQWPEYWVELFEKRGYAVIDCIREQIWNNPMVRGFYAQNMFLFCKKTENNKKLLELEKYNRTGMLRLVHPAIWEELNQYGFMKVIDKMHDNPFIYWLYVTFIKKKYF